MKRFRDRIGHPTFLGPLRKDAGMQALQTDQTVGIHLVPGDVAQWAMRLQMQCAKSVESIIELGRLLITAKSELPRGSWIRMFDDGLVPFSLDKAERLMVVARHPVLANSEHVRNLPASWSVLYELAQVPPETVAAAITDGRLTPTTSRRVVREFRISGTFPAAPTDPPLPIDPADRLEQMRTLAADGASVDQIAAAVGLSESRCRHVLSDAGIVLPADRVLSRRKRLSSTRMLEQTVIAAEGVTADVRLIDFADLDAADLPDWISRLKRARRRLANFVHRLQDFERTTTYDRTDDDGNRDSRADQTASASVEDLRDRARTDAGPAGASDAAGIPAGACR